jgi:hypothetical protein
MHCFYFQDFFLKQPIPIYEIGKRSILFWFSHKIPFQFLLCMVLLLITLYNTQIFVMQPTLALDLGKQLKLPSTTSFRGPSMKFCAHMDIVDLIIISLGALLAIRKFES